jgi:hypothetical protein
VGCHHIARKCFRIHHALENWLSENYWPCTAILRPFQKCFGAYSSFAAVSEVVWELIAPNLMILLLFR